MVVASLFMLFQTDLIGFESYIESLGVKQVSQGDQHQAGRRFLYVRENPPLTISLNVEEITDKNARFDVLAGMREGSQRPDGFDKLPRKLPNGTVLGFETLFSTNCSRKLDKITAFANHCYVIVTVSGLLIRTGNPGEVVEKEPAPQNTGQIAADLATLFLAEQESHYFKAGELRQGGKFYQTLTGLDGSIYLSLPSFANAESARYTLDPHSGAGIIHANSAIAFNLGSRYYHVGDETKSAEHIVVLKHGVAYLPQEMMVP